MKNKYLTPILVGCFLLVSYMTLYAQVKSFNNTETKIDGLSVYPNPANSNVANIVITSKTSGIKHVTIFNAIGKQVKAKTQIDNTMSISGLNTGVYILKITQNAVTETRKLIVR